uniref:Uncharacterized protein n=1 Tax=Anguilla anguilla TaxID=7936 RepID=A0A0E9WB44_ANGAN
MFTSNALNILAMPTALTESPECKPTLHAHSSLKDPMLPWRQPRTQIGLRTFSHSPCAVIQQAVFLEHLRRSILKFCKCWHHKTDLALKPSPETFLNTEAPYIIRKHVAVKKKQ